MDYLQPTAVATFIAFDAFFEAESTPLQA